MKKNAKNKPPVQKKGKLVVLATPICHFEERVGAEHVKGQRAIQQENVHVMTGEMHSLQLGTPLYLGALLLPACSEAR